MCPESGKPLETDWRWISIQMMIQRFLMENQRPNYCSPACEHTQMKRNDELASQSGKNLWQRLYCAENRTHHIRIPPNTWYHLALSAQ